MIKIAVFGCGWGGELFANYLEKELAIAEVVRLNDYPHAPYGALTWPEINGLVEQAIRPMIGAVDLIVIASCAATVAAINYLREKYPTQKFVGFEPRMADALGKFEPRRIMLIASTPVRKSIGYKVERERLALNAEIVEPDCLAWLEYADQEEMTGLRLKRGLLEQGIDMDMDLTRQIDAVIIYETSLADMKPEFEKIVGWQAVVIDGFKQIHREICGALRLIGLDGNESRRLKSQ